MSDNLCAPLSILLRCEREECPDDYTGVSWPDEYYCPCCKRDKESYWDEEENDFYCDSCKKLHDDEVTECNYHEEGLGWAVGGGCNRGDDDEDDEEGNGKTIATYHINLAEPLADWTHFRGTDGDTYLTVPCKSCGQPLHARIGVPNLDAFCAKPFWDEGGPSFPPEMFPSPFEQVYDLPNPMPKGDFNKGDFNKPANDFNKGDFNK